MGGRPSEATAKRSAGLRFELSKGCGRGPGGLLLMAAAAGTAGLCFAAAWPDRLRWEPG